MISSCYLPCFAVNCTDGFCVLKNIYSKSITTRMGGQYGNMARYCTLVYRLRKIPTHSCNTSPYCPPIWAKIYLIARNAPIDRRTRYWGYLWGQSLPGTALNFVSCYFQVRVWSTYLKEVALDNYWKASISKLFEFELMWLSHIYAGRQINTYSWQVHY